MWRLNVRMEEGLQIYSVTPNKLRRCVFTVVEKQCPPLEPLSLLELQAELMRFKN